MQGPYISTSGIAHPDDLVLLTEVYDRICRDHDLKKGSMDAEDVARAAMSLFSAGVAAEDELVSSLEEFLRRRNVPEIRLRR